MTDSEHDEPESELDSQVLFFLQHQEPILTWASLAERAQQAAEEQLRGVRLDLADDERLVAERLAVAECVREEFATGPALYRPSWCLTADGLPDVAVALGWDGKLDPGGLWPRTAIEYVGVLAAHGTEAGRAIQGALREPGAIPLARGFKWGSHWVVWKRLPPNRDWWRNLRAWRKSVVSELWTTWDLYAEAIDRAVEGAARIESRTTPSAPGELTGGRS